MTFGDTPKHDFDLCDTCHNCFKVVGQSMKETLKGCTELPSHRWPQHRVTECTMYLNKNKPTRFEMEKIATIIEVDRRGNFVGFRPPKKREKEPWEL